MEPTINPLDIIQEAESMVEAAYAESIRSHDHEKEISIYESVQETLESLQGLSKELEKNRKRVLSFCLMRKDIALVAQGYEEGSLERAREALNLAEESQNELQLARSLLNYGISLLNQGRLLEAERNWRKIILMGETRKDDQEFQDIVGWTLVVRGNVLMGKSLYSQAKELGAQAIDLMKDVDDYLGLSAAFSLMFKAFQSLGDIASAEKYCMLAEKYNHKAKGDG